MLDDKDIQRKLKSNPEQGLKALHDKYADRCFWVALRYLNDRLEAEEVVMDGYLKVYHNLNSFNYEDEKGFYPWLKRIIVNESLMRIRKKHLIKENLDSVTDATSSFDALDHLVYQDIVNLLKKIPTIYSTVFQLYEIEGYTHSDIAEKLELSIGSSKAYLHHARAQMQKLVLQYY